MLNHLVVLHSGYAAEHGTRPCLTDNVPANRIWSQGTASSPEGWLSKDYYQVNGHAIASALGEPKCDGAAATAKSAAMGVITHEYLHGFGLLDMYDQDRDDARIKMGGTGRYDIMSNANGWNRNASVPGSPAAYSRASIPGWLDPIVITQDGFYAIQPAEISAHVYKISHNFPDGEYLLIENRQPIKWDADWPFNGIMIYHVDEHEFKQTKRGYPGKPGFPADHYMVSVVQADGLYELEKGINFGEEGDFWKKGGVLGPGPTFPNTDSIQGGIQKATGVTITILSDPGFIMTFQVEGINGSKALRSSTFEGINRTGVMPPNQGHTTDSPSTTGTVLAWILSMLGGVAAMVGIVVVVL